MLNAELTDFLQTGADTSKRDKSALRIKMTLDGLSRELGLDGSVHTFGSFSNGFKTGTSDLDVVFLSNKKGQEADSAVSTLQKFAENLPSRDLGFVNITRIFQASVPILKLTDKDSEMEVDFCVNNELGVRNSLLLNTYCKYDRRVLHLGRLVKEWAKKNELVGTADGCVNSYAYMLLVVFFLQNVQPPVVPNLQMLETESFLVCDRKWGGEDYWETKFLMNVESLPPSQNTMSIGELLMQFFHFYTREFNWRQHAVCIRKHESGKHVDKNSLMLPATDDQWYVEDPFDLKHNLAGKCSRAGKKRFLDGMKEALSMLQQYGRYSRILPDNPGTEFYMKCRISQNVQPPDLLEAFEEFDLVKLHFPKPEGSMRMAQAFFQFGDAASRRRAHTKNEKYICDCQLQLHYSSQHSLAEALTQCQFSTYEMASYKMQRQVLEARMAKGQGMRPAFDGSGMMKDMQPDQIMQMGDYNQMPYKAPPPPPPPPPPQQQMYTFQDQQKMMPMAKVDPQMQMQQMYWQTHGGRATPQMMFQQPNMPPPVPPTNMQTIVPSSMHGETKPPLKSSYPKVSAKAEKEMESQKEKARAKIVNQVKPKAIQPKPVYPTRSTTGSEAWMEVKLTNYLDNILPPEQIAKLRILHEQYAKFSPVDKKPEMKNEVCLEVQVTNELVAANGDTQSFSPELQQMLLKVKDRFERSSAVTA